MLTINEKNELKKAINDPMVSSTGFHDVCIRDIEYLVRRIPFNRSYVTYELRSGFDGFICCLQISKRTPIDTIVDSIAVFIDEDLRKNGKGAYYNCYHHAPATYHPTTPYYSSLEERVKKLEEKVVKSEKFFDTVKGVEKAMDDIWGIIDKWEDMDRNLYMASSGMDAIKEILDNLED